MGTGACHPTAHRQRNFSRQNRLLSARRDAQKAPGAGKVFYTPGGKAVKFPFPIKRVTRVGAAFKVKLDFKNTDRDALWVAGVNQDGKKSWEFKRGIFSHESPEARFYHQGKRVEPDAWPKEVDEIFFGPTKPGCPYCDGSQKTLLDFKDFSQKGPYREFHVESGPLRFGTLYQCTRCRREWYLHQKKAFLLVSRKRKRLLDEWRRAPKVLPARLLAKALKIGGVFADEPLSASSWCLARWSPGKGCSTFRC